GGQLVAQALAAAGRRDQQQAPLSQQGLHRLALARPEGRVAEPREGGLEVYFAYRFCHSARMRSRFFADQSKSFGKTTLVTSLGRPSGTGNPGTLTAAKNCAAILSDWSLIAQSRNCFAAALFAPFLVRPLASIS